MFTIKAEIHNALLGDNDTEAARVLNRPGETTFFWGFDDIARAPAGDTEPHEFVVKRLNSTIPWQKLYAMWIKDQLSNLAEAVGARRLTYPEMTPEEIGAHFANAMSADQILDDIDAALGIKVVFPNPYPDELGLATSRGLVGFRALQALYQAWRIKQIAGKQSAFKVLEIGAGVGRTAYFANVLGIRDCNKFCA